MTPAHNPHPHGVYVEGHGVVQPGDDVPTRKDDEGVQDAIAGGALVDGKAPKDLTEALEAREPEYELAEPGVTDDPHPVVIETDMGMPPTAGNDDNKEEGA